MLSQYDTWYTSATPLTQMTDVSEAQVLAEQSAWSAAQTAGTVTASEQNGVVTIKNTGTGAVSVPVTVPPGTTVGGSAFGSSYGGELSGWTSVAGTGTTTLTENVAPAITSANSAASNVGARLFHHGDHHRGSFSGPHRDGLPAHRDHLHRQRQRDGHHLGHPGRRHRGLLPDHHHGQERQRDHDPDLHPDQRPGPDHHLGVDGRLHRRAPPAPTR